MLIYSEDIKPARNYTHRHEDSEHENKAGKTEKKKPTSKIEGNILPSIICECDGNDINRVKTQETLGAHCINYHLRKHFP